MAAITIAALLSEYGAFYQKGSQNERNLLAKLYKDAEFDSLFTYTPTEDTIIRNVKVTSNPVLQAFQKQFTPAGGIGFLPQPIDLFQIKADDDLYPDEIEKSYIGFLAGSGLDRKEWPIVRWWIENVFMKQFIEDIDDNAFSAVRVNPTAGTAGAPAGSMNGFKKIIQDLVAGGHTTPIATGALSTTATTFVDQIEAFVAAIPAHLRKRLPMTIAMSDVLETRYRNGMRAKYNSQYMQTEQLLTHIDYPNIKIKGFNAMAGSNKIFASTPANMILGVKRPSEMVQLDSDVRLIKAAHDHWRGYGVADPRYFWTNDLENT
jgi:hypothetical protein